MDGWMDGLRPGINTPKTVIITNLFVAQVYTGSMFQTRDSTAAKLLSPNVLRVRGTAQEHTHWGPQSI